MSDGISEDKLEEILKRVLNSKHVVDNDTHALHHEFISAYMARWEKRQLMWQKFKLSFIGGVALAIVAGLGWVGNLVVQHWPHGH